MNAENFIQLVFNSTFDSIEEMKKFYDKMCVEFDKMGEKDKTKIKNSMCLEMLERAINYNY